VLNPSFSSVPRTTFLFLDPIDPGTWLLRLVSRSKAVQYSPLGFICCKKWSEQGVFENPRHFCGSFSGT
jgi:hypothetical protein